MENNNNQPIQEPTSPTGEAAQNNNHFGNTANNPSMQNPSQASNPVNVGNTSSYQQPVHYTTIPVQSDNQPANHVNYIANQANMQNPPPKSEKVNSKTVLVCAVVVLSLICIVLGVFLALKMHDQPKDNTTQSTQTTTAVTSQTTTKPTTTTTKPTTTTTTTAPTTQPTTASVQGERVRVQLDVAGGSGNLLNIRTGPGYDYGIKTTIQNGTVVTRLYQENGWSYIDYGTGQGWCDTEVAGF